MVSKRLKREKKTKSTRSLKENMMHNPPHPGEILQEEIIVPLGLTVTQAAARLGMSRVALSRVINGHAAISADLALRLERAGVSTARLWLGLQAAWDLAQAAKRKQPPVGTLRVPIAEHTAG